MKQVTGNLSRRWPVCAFVVASGLIAAATPGTAAETLVPPPPGYYEVFKSDFSRTTLTPDTYGGDQWWYRLAGGEFGYDWQNCPAVSGPSGRAPRIQTLVAGSSELARYMQSAIVDERGAQGKVLRCTNLLDDPNYHSLSRNQIYFALDKQIDKLFYEFKFKLPAATADVLKNRPGKWWDFTEFHNNVGPDGHAYRLSFYIEYAGTSEQPSPDSAIKGFYFRARLYDDTTKSVVWVDDTPIEEIWKPNASSTAWDTWHTMNVLVEATGSGPADGLVRAWVDGRQICNRTASPLGWPWANVHIFKSYVGARAMTGDPLHFYMDDLKIYRGGRAKAREGR